MARADGGDMAEGRREEASLPGSGKEPPLDSASEKARSPRACGKHRAPRNRRRLWNPLLAKARGTRGPPVCEDGSSGLRGLPSVGQQQGPGLEPSVGQGLFFRRELKCFTW